MVDLIVILFCGMLIGFSVAMMVLDNRIKKLAQEFRKYREVTQKHRTTTQRLLEHRQATIEAYQDYIRNMKTEAE